MKKDSIRAIVQRMEKEGKLSSTPKSRYRRSRTKIVVDSFDEEAIRYKLYTMYERKEQVTLDRLLVKLMCLRNLYTHNE